MFEQYLQAVGLPPLDAHVGPRHRDMPDEPTERPSYKRQQARWLLRQAARLADSLACASTPGDERKKREEIARLKSEADRLLEERRQKLMDVDRAAFRPPNQYTEAAWGALPGEPLPEFPRALRRMLLELGVGVDVADKMVDPGAGKGKDTKGRGKGKGTR